MSGWEMRNGGWHPLEHGDPWDSGGLSGFHQEEVECIQRVRQKESEREKPLATLLRIYYKCRKIGQIALEPSKEKYVRRSEDDLAFRTRLVFFVFFLE